MSTALDTLNYLVKMHADTLGARAVAYLRRCAGPATANRVARLAMAAIQERHPEVHGATDGWVEDSPSLYITHLQEAVRLGHITESKSDELLAAFRSCFTAGERLALICKLRTAIARADTRKSLDKIQNKHVLEEALANRQAAA